MDTKSRIEQAIERAVGRAVGKPAPPKVAGAVRHAVFPGGARVRPRLCLAVAKACGDDQPELTDGALAAVELLHCASLVHDDMPCFDDASTRRGRPSVHVAYGEPLALLTGDALIVLAFETIALAGASAPERIAPLVSIVAAAVGMPNGIVAGQAWESEPAVEVEAYHRAKTGALFVGSAMAGAVAAGADPAPWRALGDRLGAAYQAADDLRDAFAEPDEIGKPAGQDIAHHRPSLVEECGAKDTVSQLEQFVADAIGAIPPCPGEDDLKALIMGEAKRLMPKKLARHAA